MFFKKKEPLGAAEYIIAGLGNPDRKYENTRHNAGFMTIDALSEKYDVCVDRIKYKSLCATVNIEGKKVLLLKPSTYMNLSGQAVTEAMNFFKIPPEKTLIILDDITQPVGHLRIRRKGSDGGHNGMKNIIYLSGSDQFPRIKVGIGQKPPQWDLADWVLSTFTRTEQPELEKAIDNACTAAGLILDGQIDKAMNLFN
ncbi:MAG: aminoacyl-tRNA hydrolase [Clostridia bacterium]|nr:aminoacyl-tRNA hydrolase [Clostridia bacterium]HCA54184.1 aminoacyl-tRNA hydrolase [Oscillospiraceae bacterium]